MVTTLEGYPTLVMTIRYWDGLPRAPNSLRIGDYVIATDAKVTFRFVSPAGMEVDTHYPRQIEEDPNLPVTG
jgi:hypothetical protein